MENAAGNVSVIVGSGFYNAPIVNGTAIATISGLNNTSTAYVLFLGDDNYDMGFASVNITVLPAKENVTITASPVTATYNINKNWHGVAQAKAVIFFILVAVMAIAQQYATRSKED